MLDKPASCKGCPLDPFSKGFMQATGSGSYGVMLVGEALGVTEMEEGEPFVGASGSILTDAITRAGLDRGGFTLANAVWCRPPKNALKGEAYEEGAVAHCFKTNLEPLINRINPKVIVPLGNVPLKAILDMGEILSVRGYPQPWRKHIVLPSIHPSFILRGNPQYESILIHDLEKAVRIARDGWHPAHPRYLLDPDPSAALAWVEKALYHPAVSSAPPPVLAYDIETPRSAVKDEDEQDIDVNVKIIRISFSSSPGTGMSIWASKKYQHVIDRALSSPNKKVVWNAAFDNPILEANGYQIGGEVYDGMIAWHVLHSSLPKGLGFVSSILLPDQPRWKHLSGQAPAYYSAVDSDAALRCTLKTFDLLRETDMWEHYERYVQRMEPLYAQMRAAGMPIDADTREGAARLLGIAQDQVQEDIEQVVPTELMPSKLYKQLEKARVKYPEGEEVDYDREEKYCSVCGRAGNLSSKHPCLKSGAVLRSRTVTAKGWRVAEKYVVSPPRILQYADLHEHRVPIAKGGGRTTNETALRTLILRYPDDPFYPHVLDHREMTKLRGTYIGRIESIGCESEKAGGIPGEVVKGGIPVRADGRVHPSITNNPDTLRTSMTHPNLQQIPRGRGLALLVKKMFVTDPDKMLWEIDFSALEALLVGYFARSPQLLRLSRLGVHDYINAHALHTLDGLVVSSELPDPSWSDEDLAACLKGFKKRFPAERDVRKRLIHGHNYRMGPFKAQEVILKEMGKVVPVAEIKQFLRFKDELFPEVEQWHRNLCFRVDGWDESADPGLGIEAGAGWCRNPSGFVHRYHRALERKRLKKGGWTWAFGAASKSLIAFNPQHAGAAIGKDALYALHSEYPEVFKDVRLFIHDSIVGESDVAVVDEVVATVADVMSRPIPWLPLPAEWGMGEHLHVGTETKLGRSWGDM